MRYAISETRRRRALQQKYNEEHNITPKTVTKDVRSVIEATRAAEAADEYYSTRKPDELTKKELADYVKKLEKEMREAAKELQFEKAAMLRDVLFEYKSKL